MFSSLILCLHLSNQKFPIEMPSVLCEVKLRPEPPSFGLRDELSSVLPHWCGGGGLMSFPGTAAD